MRAPTKVEGSPCRGLGSARPAADVRWCGAWHGSGMVSAPIDSPHRCCAPAEDRRRRRWLAVLLGMAATTGGAALADPVAGIDLVVTVGQDSAAVEQVTITLTSLLAGLAAWGTLELLERWTSRPRAIWMVLAAAVFGISLLGPLAATTAPAAAVLLGLHVVEALILAWGVGASALRPRCELRTGSSPFGHAREGLLE